MDLRAEAWETASARSGGASFSVTGGLSGDMTAEISEEADGRGKEKVFVALPEQHKNGKSTLAWALRLVAAMPPAASDDGPGDAAVATVVVVAHVHAPAQMIPVSTYSLPSPIVVQHQYTTETSDLFPHVIQFDSGMVADC